MALSQSNIRNVRVMPDGPDLFISWDSVGPADEVFQVYVNRQLAWSGRARRCCVPAGVPGVNTWIEVGTVPADESTTDHSSTLAAGSPRTDSALLRWQGGTYLDPAGTDDILAFRIYGSASPGTPVDFNNLLAQVPAYPLGVIVDGFGKGGFGSGGFGRAASSYSWHSPPLAPGTWSFAVVPCGRSGATPGTSPLTTSVTLATPPRPPGQLTFEYDTPATRTGTLRWSGSPSY